MMRACTNTLRRYFAAVGGDGPAFEAWPRKTEWYLHEYLLALWGCIIGEMFDLEVSTLSVMKNITDSSKGIKALSKACEERQRWTFFFTSAPLNTPGEHRS